MSDDWDVDSYKSEFENDEHWQLRRSFMLAHKDKFPEDELVCLAQAFTNIEFMGCRYPDKTMIRIAELAKGVVEKFREQRKNSLKRTFVAASDAASAKVKGRSSRGEESVPANKIKKIEQTDESTKSTEEKEVETAGVRRSKYGGVKTFNIKQSEQPQACDLKVSDSPVSEDEEDFKKNTMDSLGNFVLILGNSDEHPVDIIQKSSALNKCLIRWDFEEINSSHTCKLYLNNQFIAMSSGASVKMSKEYTAMVAIAKLRESHYGIRIKSKFFSDTTVTPAQLGAGSETPSSQLGEDNIGRKLMKLMGWQGGGLGSQEQGIENPVTASVQVRREGLGLNKSSNTQVEFKKKAREYIKTWLDSNSDQDLVFSTDFSLEERKTMHLIAKSFSLKSRSYGKNSNRRLIISRKCDLWELVQELLRVGGSSGKYELLLPTKT